LVRDNKRIPLFPWIRAFARFRLQLVLFGLVASLIALGAAAGVSAMPLYSPAAAKGVLKPSCELAHVRVAAEWFVDRLSLSLRCHWW
jgi:hypothetical protein